MRKRLLMLLVLIAAVVVATGCCEWAKRNCPGSQPLPGPVIRLGLQNGPGVWTVDGKTQQALTESAKRLRDDFIGVGTKSMMCTVNGVEVDVTWVRLRFSTHTLLISRPTSGSSDHPHWLVEGRNGATYELLPDQNAPSGFIPPELVAPTGVETSVDGTNRECSGLKLQVWLSR